MSTIWNYLSVPNPASGAIPFVGLDNVSINVDVLNFYWNKTTAQLSVATNGDYTGTDSINGYFQHDQYLPNGQIGANPTTASGTSPGFTTSTSRGTGQIPQVSSNSDFAGHFSSWIYTGASPVYTPGTSIYSLAKGVSSAASGIGGELHIATKADGGVLTDRLVFDNAGGVVLTGNLTVSGTISSAALLTGAFSGSFNATLGTVVANGMYLPAANTLAFSTNSTRNLTLDSGGRLLVNLASTGAGNEPFQVNGSSNISGTTTLGNVNVTLSNIPSNGIYLAAANTLGIGVNGNNMANVNVVGLGVGMIPANAIDVTKNQNFGSLISVKNGTAGTASTAGFAAASDIVTAELLAYSSTFTSSGMQKATGATLLTVSATSFNIGTFTNAPVFMYVNNTQVAQFGAAAFTLSAGITLTLNGGTLLSTNAALTNGAAAAVATMTNGPTAGNPTKWIPINDNGTTRFIPAW